MPQKSHFVSIGLHSLIMFKLIKPIASRALASSRRSYVALRAEGQVNKPVLVFQTAAVFSVVSGAVYFFYPGQTNPESQKVDESDPLNKFTALDIKTVNRMLQEHQTSHKVDVVNQKANNVHVTPLVRYDTSSVASNSPSEDRHCEHTLNGNYYFGYELRFNL